MKIKNYDLIKAINAINDLKQKEMPVKFVYKLLSNYQLLMDQYLIYENVLKTLNNNEEKIKELLEIENEVSVTPFSMQEIEDSNILLTPEEAIGIKVMVNG